MNRFFWVLFLIAVLIRPIQLLYNQRDVFFSPGYEKRYELFKNLYYSSQYVQKINPGIIPDNTLESFAGGIFIKGLNPILIVHDQPPLGRYLIGLSIFLFDNPNTLTVPLLIFTGIGIFLISRIIIQDLLFSIIPVAVFINEPLFLSKFIYTPLLEPIQLPFIVFSLYFFIKGVLDKKYISWFILTSLMLGFVISIRFFILGGGIVLSMMLYLLSQKVDIKKFLVFLLTLPLSLIVLLLSYSKTIIAGYSILQIFGIQKYIFFYHASKFILPLSFWDLLLFNRWHTWWGSRAITSDQQWVIFWPITAIFTVVFLIMVLTKKMSISKPEIIIFLWIGVIVIMLSTGHTSTRYFLSLIPFLYILAVSFAYRFLKRLDYRELLKKKK